MTEGNSEAMNKHTVNAVPVGNADTPKRPKKFRKHTCGSCGHWFYSATALVNHMTRGYCTGVVRVEQRG